MDSSTPKTCCDSSGCSSRWAPSTTRTEGLRLRPRGHREWAGGPRGRRAEGERAGGGAAPAPRNPPRTGASVQVGPGPHGATPCPTEGTGARAPPRNAAHLGMGQWAAVITHLGQTRKPPQKCCPSIWMEAMKGQEWGSAAFPPITRLPWAPGGCGRSAAAGGPQRHPRVLRLQPQAPRPHPGWLGGTGPAAPAAPLPAGPSAGSSTEPPRLRMSRAVTMLVRCGPLPPPVGPPGVRGGG